MKYNLLLAGLFLMLGRVEGQITAACDEPGVLQLFNNLEDACVNCNFHGYIGSTAGWAPASVPPDFCGTDPAPQWVGFIPVLSNYIFTITPSNCQQGKGVQAAVYHHFDEPALVCAGGCDTCGNTPLVLSAENLVPGVSYFLGISGYDQDVCDILVQIGPPMIPELPIPNFITGLSGPATVCPAGTANYSCEEVFYSGHYIWAYDGPPGLLINGMSPPVKLERGIGENVEVTFPEAAIGTTVILSVTPANACKEGAPVHKVITLGNSAVYEYPDAVVCAEDTPYILPWGETAMGTGSYTYNYVNNSGCDSTVQQFVQFLPPQNTVKTRYICQGTAVDICGNSYATTGTYITHCTSFQGCDSTVTLHLNVLSPLAQIVAPDTLLVCGTSQTTLLSVPSPNAPGVSLKTWKNLSNGTVTTGESWMVNQPGTYVLTTTMSAGGQICTMQDTVTVVFNPDFEPVTVNGTVSNLLTCTMDTATLTGTISGPATIFQWEGPAGFISGNMVTAVGIPGIYTFSAANENCNAAVSVQVVKSIFAATISPKASTIGCDLPASISANASLSQQLYQWISPENNLFYTENLESTVPGWYRVTVTNPKNGCTVSDSVWVPIDTVPPVVQVTTVHTIGDQLTGSVWANTSGGAAPYSFLWTLQGAEMGTTQGLNNLDSGTYVVQVTGVNHCSAIASGVVEKLTVGVGAPDILAGWEVSPNPATDFLNLRWSPLLSPGTTILGWDMSGKLQFEIPVPPGAGSYRANIAAIPAGLYRLEMVTTDGRRQFCKLVKK